MQRITKLSLILLSILLTSCSYFHSDDHSFIQHRDTDYLKANSIRPLKIPTGLSTSNISAHYPVPNKYYPTSKQPVSLIPPGLNTSGN